MSADRDREHLPGAAPGGRHAERARLARAQIEASIEDSWRQHRAARNGAPDDEAALDILEDPSRHPWRLVDAALDRLHCTECGRGLGTGPRGCRPCDTADGYRFAAQEPDRDGAPRGNEHAIRVSTAVVRAPARYPDWAVRSNEVFLPLFLAGDMPTRLEQETILAAWKKGRILPDLEGVTSFADLARVAEGAAAPGGASTMPARRDWGEPNGGSSGLQ